MLLNLHLASQRQPNSSATSGFVWEQIDFYGCAGLEGGKYIWAVFTMLCFVFGFPASIAILWEMFKIHKRGTPFTPNDFFILNLSIMDAVFLALIPSGILNHFVWMNWPFEATWNLFYALSTCGRPLLMACICVDCYLAVVHPITYHKRKSLTPRVVMAAIIWALTVAVGVVYFLFYKLYFTMFSTVPYITAIVIIGICDFFILRTLITSDQGRENIHPQKQRAIQTLINSLVMTVLSYLPPVVLLAVCIPLISNFNTLMCSVGIPITVTSSVGSAVMPILHLMNHRTLGRFRPGCCRRNKPPNTTLVDISLSSP